MTCATCGKTAEKLKALSRAWWECSHVDCPNRKREPVLDHAAPQQYAGGYVAAPHEHAAGCYRVTPTTED